MLKKGRECLNYDAHAGSKFRFILHTECRHSRKLQQTEENHFSVNNNVAYWSY